MRSRRHRLLLTTLTIAPVLAVAAEPDDIDFFSLSLDELAKIRVTSATKREQTTVEAPSVVSVITRQQIDDYGWTSLNEILYRQPGFGPAQDYERRTVGSRGNWESWNNNHLLLQIDGVGANDCYIGTAFTWEITPLFMVKNVEILRGPGSALYGSTATNGVISINTLSAADLNTGGQLTQRNADDNSYYFDVVSGFKGKRLFSAVAGYASHKTPGNNVLSYDISGRGIDSSGNGVLQKFETQDARRNWYGWLKLEGEQQLQGLTVQFHDQFWNYQTVYGYGFWIPDHPDDDTDERKLLTMTYQPDSEGAWRQRYALRWQTHEFRWNMRLYPNGAFDNLYPSGASEYVSSSVSEWFGRAELGYTMTDGMDMLAGIELSRTDYRGDDEHYANYDPDAGGAPTPDGEFIPLGPLLDVVKNNPMTNAAPYLQFSSGQLFGDKLQLTLGARYDYTSLEINPGVRAIYAGTPSSTRHFKQFNPRLAMVYQLQPDLALKFMAGTAFRAPSIAEIGGAHNYFVGAEPLKLQPEKVTTTELAIDWRVNQEISWRTNVFQNKYEDFVSSSPTTLNASANLFTLTTRGLETELLFGSNDLSGFLNYAYAERVDEEVTVTDIAASPDQITWQPATRINAGAIYRVAGWTLSLNAHYEGSVHRRDSDVGVQTNPFGSRTLDMDAYRPRNLDSWITLDGKVSYDLADGINVFISGRNLLDTDKNYLAKNGAYPFDYLQEGRQFYLGTRITF